MALVVPREEALLYEAAHDFVPGVGYVTIGLPEVRVPPIYPPSACTPPDDTQDGATVGLLSPGDVPVAFVWSKEKHLFRVRLLGRGNRLAYSPAYLASYGWKLQ